MWRWRAQQPDDGAASDRARRIGNRLLPNFERPLRVRARTWLQNRMEAPSAASLRAWRGAGISFDDIGCDSFGAGASDSAFPRERAFCSRLGADWFARCNSRVGPCDRADQSRGDGFFWPACACRVSIFAPEFPSICERWLWFRRCFLRRRKFKEQVERLEVHYLANPDGHIHFALLSDWADATSETLPADDELLASAVSGIARTE